MSLAMFWTRGSAAATDSREGWTRAELEAHVRDEHSTFTWLFEPMLRRAGFEIRERWFSDPDIRALRLHQGMTQLDAASPSGGGSSRRERSMR
jgi:hypothetical protein